MTQCPPKPLALPPPPLHQPDHPTTDCSSSSSLCLLYPHVAGNCILYSVLTTTTKINSLITYANSSRLQLLSSLTRQSRTVISTHTASTHTQTRTHTNIHTSTLTQHIHALNVTRKFLSPIYKYQLSISRSFLPTAW